MIEESRHAAASVGVLFGEDVYLVSKKDLRVLEAAKKWAKSTRDFDEECDLWKYEESMHAVFQAEEVLLRAIEVDDTSRQEDHETMRVLSSQLPAQEAWNRVAQLVRELARLAEAARATEAR